MPTRIILKPAGAMTILIAFATLIVLLLRHGGNAPKPVAFAAPTPTSIASPVSILQNSGFESDYRPVQPHGDKAVVSGDTAHPWRDDSDWAKVNVAYDQDKTVFHTGASSQKIEVRSVQAGPVGGVANVVQFVQPVDLAKGRRFSAAIWVRADRLVPVEIALRQAGEPFTNFGSRVVTVGTAWQQVDVEAVVPQSGSAFFLLHLSQPGTVWVDDATLTSAPG